MDNTLWLKDSNRLIMLKTFLEIDFFFFFSPYISAFLEMIFLFHISNVTSNRQVYLRGNFKMIEIATSQPKNPICGKYFNNLFPISFFFFYSPKAQLLGTSHCPFPCCQGNYLYTTSLDKKEVKLE